MSEMPPTVSVVIPSFNSVQTISRCLESVRNQTHEPTEIVVVDSCSTDGTAETARRFAKVIVVDSSATRARLIGVQAATGDYILNLDTDQRLAAWALEAAIATSKSVVAFGEVSTGSGLVARINRLDKATVNRNWQLNLDPISGFIRPRFYRRDLLLQAFGMIPDKIMDVKPCPFSEDSLLFWHANVRADEVGFVPDAILHEETTRLLEYARKWKGYGQTAKVYRGTSYSVFATSRGKRSVQGIRRFATAPGLAIRAFPFLIGYYL